MIGWAVVWNMLWKQIIVENNLQMHGGHIVESHDPPWRKTAKIT